MGRILLGEAGSPGRAEFKPETRTGAGSVPSRGFRIAGAVIALVSSFVLRAAAPSAAPPIATTRSVYAAFTLNLTRFVSWPTGAFSAPDAPLIIGTFPRDPINADLDQAVQGEEVNGHPVRTVRIQSLEELLKCHVVFVSASTGRQAAVIQRVVRKPVLTISDGDGFLELGGHVRFVPQPPRTGLKISVENLKASGLECRSQLLRIAAAP